MRATALLALVLAACASGGTTYSDHGPPPDFPHPPGVTVVHGLLLAADGTPSRSGGEVWISWSVADGDRCPLLPFTRAVRVRADGAGAFRATLQTPERPEHLGCVDVVAGNDAGQFVTQRALRARFRPVPPGGTPLDSLRVGVRFR